MTESPHSRVQANSHATRGAWGRGTIIPKKTKTKGTVYVVVYSYVDQSGKRRRPQITFPTRAAARAGAQQLEAEKATKGRVTSASTITVKDLAVRWLDQLDCVSGTREQREIALRTKIVPFLGRKRIFELTPESIDQWKNMLRESTGHEALRTAWSVLRILLDYAVQLKILTSHPMYGLKAPPKQRKEIIPFSDEELAKIWHAVAGHRLRPLLQVIYSLGLRQGEALGLKWEDLDLEAGTLTICRQALDESGHLVIREKTKTKAGLRTLQLSEAHRTFFEARRLAAEDEGLWPEGYRGDIGKKPATFQTGKGREKPMASCPWIFPNSRGEPILRGNLLSKFWAPLLEQLRIPHRGLHHFRHTAATQMLLDGAPLLDVAGTLGHSKADTTLKLYAHVIQKTHGAALGSLATRAAATQPEVERS